MSWIVGFRGHQMTDALKQFWVKWYFRDWTADTAVQSLSREARGDWINLVNRMLEHQAVGHGRLSGSCRELSTLAGCSASQMLKTVNELRATGAADVTAACGGAITRTLRSDKTLITITNRRIARIWDKRVRSAAASKKYRDGQKEK